LPSLRFGKTGFVFSQVETFVEAPKKEIFVKEFFGRSFVAKNAPQAKIFCSAMFLVRAN